MSTASNYSTFQVSGDESKYVYPTNFGYSQFPEDHQRSWLSVSRRKGEHSYQMQQYLQADPTVTKRLAQSTTSMEDKKGGKKHGTKESMKKLKKRLADLEDVIQGTSSSAV